MGGEEDASLQREEASSRRKHHKHSSKCRSLSQSRSENRHSKKLKRKRQSSCESSNRSASNSESSRSVSPAHKKRKKCKDKKTKRHSDKLKKKKKKKHHHHHHHKKDKDAKLKTSTETKAVEVSVIGPDAPRSIGPKSCTKTTDSGSQNAASVRRSMKPMTKEEWDKRQSVVRRVYDPETGRHRLVRGEGEIIEEIVSRDRHKEINKVATRGDGLFYQLQAGLAKKH